MITSAFSLVFPFFQSYVLYIVGNSNVVNDLRISDQIFNKKYKLLHSKFIFLISLLVSILSFQILSMEILNVMSLNIRLNLWQTNLTAQCVLLLLLIPLIGAIMLSNKFTTYPFEVLFTSVFILSLQLILWWIGNLLPLTVKEDSPALFISFFSYPCLQAYVARLSVIGTFVSAIVTAFGAVSFPVEQLTISSGIDSKYILTREKSLTQFVK